MIYEWDREKAAQNERKHGVSFDEATTVFLDPLAITFDDPDHSLSDRRFITIGTSTNQRLLFVAHADGDDDRIRIISAREQHVRKLMTTKNAAQKVSDELRPEYDLSKLTGGVRGKYYKRATVGTTLVLLEPDVAEAFPDGQTVNQVLRAVVKVARTQAGTISGGLPNKPMQPTRSAAKPRRVPSARKRREPRRG